MTEPKKLTRDVAGGMLGGVCAGIGEYFGVDKTIVRVVTVLIAIFTLFIPTAIAYVVLWIIIPAKNATTMPMTTAPPPPS